MQVNEQRILDLFLKMVQIDSVSYEEKPMGDFLEEYFQARGLEVYRDKAGEQFGGNGSNILVHIPGTIEGDSICFNAHQDTVSPGKGIVPVVKDGFVHSQGDTILAGDDKAGIASILEAYEYVRENNIPHRDLYLFFTICEELNMMGIKHFDYTKLPCKNILIVDAPGTPGKISLAGPAKDGIVATFKGKKAHAGIEPEKGANAACMVANAIARVKFGRVDEETTSNIGRIEGGGQTNVVTEDAFFTAEVRSRNSQKLIEQVELIRKACEDAARELGGSVVFEVSHDYPEIKLDKESFIYKQLLKAYDKEGIKVEYVMAGGGGDSNIMAGHGYQCCGIGCGMRDVHSTDESLCLEDMHMAVRLIVTMMTE